MQFCEYKGYTFGIPRKELATTVRNVLLHDSRVDSGSAMAAQAEVIWHKSERPYYNVYPGIQESLEKLDLSKVRLDMLGFPFMSLLIRTHKDGAAIVVHKPGMDKLVLIIEANKQRFAVGLRVDNKETIGQVLDEEACSDPVAMRFLKIACGCGLLHDGILEAEVLSRDYGINALTEPERYAAAVDRARRRGKVGWAIGKAYEVIPHVRRPHLAVMWTGTGRQVQKIVMRSGCVVHRKKAEQLPTGFNPSPDIDHNLERKDL